MRWHRDQRYGLLSGPAGALAVVLAAALAGCSGDGRPNVGAAYPVKGKVTLPDGKAPPKVNVVFSGPVTGSVTTESDGTFEFKGDNAGLPAGEYKVRLESAESKGSVKRPVVPFPGKYLDEDASGLTAVVKADGPNDFDLKLTKGEAEGKGAHR
jgi:hypothetical protein